jgi:hypothetical protein
VNIAAPTQVASSGPIGSHFTQSGSVIFQDDFSRQTDSWATGSYKDDNGNITSTVDYYDNDMVIEVINPKDLDFATYQYDFSDIQISVDTYIYQASGYGEYGIICGYQSDRGFYTLTISEDGLFNISMYYNDVWTYLVEWTQTDIISQGDAATLTATCANGKLSLAYNDTLLAEVIDSTLTSGMVGLYTGTYDTGNLIVGFDNFIVRQQ